VRLGLALLALTLALPGVACARIELEHFGRFRQPVYVAGSPSDPQRVFVVERIGRIVVVKNGRKINRPFLDISRHVSTEAEQGLLSMAFAPDYRKSGRFYVDYTDRGGDIEIREFRRSRKSADLADPRSGRTVLKIEHSRYPHHEGGQIQFGPDGMLYIGVGDGGGIGDPSGNAQSLHTPLGKILRIDPRPTKSGPFGIPTDNPFVGRQNSLHEIWAYGFRNPWRFSFDRVTGDLIIGDVGQDKFEEIDFVPHGTGAGENFGWNIFEGRHRYKRGAAVPPNVVSPVLERPHSAGFCAIVGGYVVRDRSLSGLYGRYVYGDDCRSRIYSVELKYGGLSGNRVLMGGMDHVVSFGEDGRGRVYCVSLGGWVYRLGAGD
jgi:glucose/arabinose dehydrogenase